MIILVLKKTIFWERNGNTPYAAPKKSETKSKSVPAKLHFSNAKASVIKKAKGTRFNKNSIIDRVENFCNYYSQILNKTNFDDSAHLLSYMKIIKRTKIVEKISKVKHEG